MTLRPSKDLSLASGDALIAVDLQKDFLPGGNLPVPQGDQAVTAFNRYIDAAKSKGLPIFATRDWHTPDHCSFKGQGGPWPPHCVADSEGAQFADNLRLPPATVVISTGTEADKDGYSGFEGTDLDRRLRSAGIGRLLIGGLATDYCVLNTVKDALQLGYQVLLLDDAVRAVNVHPDDGQQAIDEMIRLGAVPIRYEMLKL